VVAFLRIGSAAVTTGGGTSTSLAFTVPLGAQAGDTIGIWISDALISQTYSVPGSPAFTAQTTVAGSASGTVCLFSRVMDGTEGWTPGTSTVTVTLGTANPASGIIFAVGGTGGADPAFTSSGQVNVASTTVSVAGTTTANAGDLLVWLGFSVGTIGGGTAPGTITLPAGIAAAAPQVNSTGAGTFTNTGVIMGTGFAASPGATGSFNGTDSGSFHNGGLLLSFSDAGTTLPAPLQAHGAAALLAAGSQGSAPQLAGHGALSARARTATTARADGRGNLHATATVTASVVLTGRAVLAPRVVVRARVSLAGASAFSGIGIIRPGAHLTGSGRLSAVTRKPARAHLGGAGKMTSHFKVIILRQHFDPDSGGYLSAIATVTSPHVDEVFTMKLYERIRVQLIDDPPGHDTPLDPQDTGRPLT
jgi:hypothetical protein